MVICVDMVGPKRGETLEDIKESLAYVDYFFPNYEEASRLTGKKTWKKLRMCSSDWV